MVFDHKAFIKNLPARPGVYRMLDQAGKVLYVGKAKNLKNRVSSYFNAGHKGSKTEALVAKIAAVDITLTHSETEALLLEYNLIQALKPPYNILFRDDKSYPYIYLSSQDKFPQLVYHRGPQTRPGRYFGPFPNAGAVRDSLLLIRKTFKLRQCENSFFRHRTRPCLQYQINQCSAPCVGFISAEQYAESIAHGILLLEGKNTQLLKKLTRLMTAAASDLAFEKAAQYRDQIARLRRLQEQQHVSTGQGNIDIIGIDLQSGMACVQILCIRQGRMLGGKHYLPKLPTLTQANELLEAFLPSYYLSQKIIDNIPEQLIVSTAFTAANALLEAINDKFGRRIKIISQPKGDKASWLALANTNAAHQLTSHLAGKAHNQEQLYALSQALDMAEPPQRLECFDISHSQGEATVASCVVFKQGGPVKAEYRRFNITQVKAGDDYAAIRQAVARRYGRIVKEQAKLPDIVFIDGGKGQLSQAMVALDELQLGQLLVIAVAKGVERKPGLEVLFTNDGRTLELGADSRALHLVQRIRDEAHRFALTGHRQRRAKGRRQSTLQQIAGVGTKRRQALLTHYGGLKEVMSASAEDLAKVPGISRQMANTIYQHLHDNQ